MPKENTSLDIESGIQKTNETEQDPLLLESNQTDEIVEDPVTSEGGCREKMYVVRKFCCGVDMRIGGILMAILEILISGGGYSFLGLEYSSYPSTWMYLVISITCIVVAVISFVAGLCLLIGSIGYNKIASRVYLVLKMIQIVVTMVATILPALILAGTLKPHREDWVTGLISIIYLTIYLLCTPINIYFWVSVFSFYKGLVNKEIIPPA